SRAIVGRINPAPQTCAMPTSGKSSLYGESSVWLTMSNGAVSARRFLVILLTGFAGFALLLEVDRVPTIWHNADEPGGLLGRRFAPLRCRVGCCIRSGATSLAH